MEKPKFPSEGSSSSLPKGSSSSLPRSGKEGAKNFLKKPPTPEEMISYYEAQGMESKEAAMKVIQDLQGILFRVIGSKSKSQMANSPAEVSRKLDTANTRLAILEMKLDAKPGYLESLGLGVAAGATLQGIGSIVPHVAGAFGQIWNTVRSSSNPRP
ncbi:hypothetical protein ACLOJK_030859 [Asimina triloba]